MVSHCFSPNQFYQSFTGQKAAPAKEQSVLSTQGPVCNSGLPKWKMYAVIKESPPNFLIHQCQLSPTEHFLIVSQLATLPGENLVLSTDL